MEQVLDEIIATLWTLGEPELMKVCHYLKCSEPTGEGFNRQTCRPITKMVETTICEIEDGEEPQVLQQFV